MDGRLKVHLLFTAESFKMWGDTRRMASEFKQVQSAAAESVLTAMGAGAFEAPGKPKGGKGDPRGTPDEAKEVIPKPGHVTNAVREAT